MLRVNSCEVRNRELQEEIKHKPQPWSEGRGQADSSAPVTVLQGSKWHILLYLWPAKTVAMLLMPSCQMGMDGKPSQTSCHSLLGMSGEINLSAGVGWPWRAVSTDHSHPGTAAMA